MARSWGSEPAHPAWISPLQLPQRAGARAGPHWPRILRGILGRPWPVLPGASFGQAARLLPLPPRGGQRAWLSPLFLGQKTHTGPIARAPQPQPKEVHPRGKRQASGEQWHTGPVGGGPSVAPHLPGHLQVCVHARFFPPTAPKYCIPIPCGYQNLELWYPLELELPAFWPGIAPASL